MINHLMAWALLLVSGAYIWLHDLSWWVESPSGVLLLSGLLAVYWFGRPWRMRFQIGVLSAGEKGLLLLAGLLFFVGVLTGFSVLLVIGWAMLAYRYLVWGFESDSGVKLVRLLPFLMLAFPWILLEGDAIGWYFRFSGALTNEALFALGGFDVQREGVNILINGLPIEIVDACNGLDTLQAMLLAGGLLGFVFFGRAKHYWWVWPVLVLFAWVANTLRIFLFSVVGLSHGPEYVMGPFHEWGGSLAVALMFALCAFVFAVISREVSTK